MDESDQPSDEYAWRALAAVRRVDAGAVGRTDLESVVNDLRIALLTTPLAKINGAQSSGRWVRSAVYYLTGKTARTEACIEWLRKTGRFTEGQVKTARRVRFFTEEENGQVVVRKQPLQEQHATLIIGLLCLIAGLWIGWVLFGSQTGLMQIVCSYLIGLTLGAAAGRALDYSFRLARLRCKVLDMAPVFADRFQSPH